MSDAERSTVDTSRTDEEKLKALIRKDLDPGITRMAEAALEKIQSEGSS